MHSIHVSCSLKNHKPHTCIHGITPLRAGEGGKLRGWGGGGGKLPVFWLHQEDSRQVSSKACMACKVGCRCVDN